MKKTKSSVALREKWEYKMKKNQTDSKLKAR